MSLYNAVLKLPPDRDGFGPCDDDWKLVRRAEARSADGRASRIYVQRMPAHFWRFVSGDSQITTGSGREVATLLERVAGALAAGVIGFTFNGDAIKLTGSGKNAEDLIAAFERERAREMVGFRECDGAGRPGH